MLVLDFRDTVFQSDPFAEIRALVDGGSKKELWLFEEHWPYKKIGGCIFNTGWIRDCWGREAVDTVRDKTVICSGSIMGTRVGIEKFEHRLLAEVSVKQCHQFNVESDQGYTNWLYYSGELSKSVDVHVFPRGQGPVNTIGAFVGSRHRYANGYDVMKQLRTKDGWVMQCPPPGTVSEASLKCDAGPAKVSGVVVESASSSARCRRVFSHGFADVRRLEMPRSPPPPPLAVRHQTSLQHVPHGQRRAPQL